MKRVLTALLLLCLGSGLGFGSGPADAPTAQMTRGPVRVSKDGKGFMLSDSGEKFTPWGFNYDHDASNRLLEYYWKDEWTAVTSDFEEMKALGANTVRIHLQVSRFMKSAEDSDPESLELLARLLKIAERTGLYLDITGGSKDAAAGWLGFYWGKTIDEYRKEKRGIAGDLTLKWLEYFAKKTPSMMRPGTNQEP